MTAPTPKAMVVLCECGPIIKDLIDLDELAVATSELPGVGFVTRHATLCSADGRAFLAEKLREHPDLVPVVAACTPREHAEGFSAACEEAGRNSYVLARANIREQVAWVTPDKADATAKAADLVAAAVARVAFQEPLTAPEIECETSALVVGSGIAGITAALMLADAGRSVTLVEREPAVGGRVPLLSEIYPGMDCAPCLLDPLMDRALHHPNIEVLTCSEVEDVLGYLGNFTVTVRHHARHVDADGCYGCRTCHAACPVEVPDPLNAGRSTRGAIYIPYAGALPNASVIDEGSCLHFTGGTCDACIAACPFGNIDLSSEDELLERRVGAIVVATGSTISTSDDAVWDLPSVVTTWEFERMVNPDGPTGGEIRLADKSVPRRIALVHCADANAEAPAATCSGTCCLALAKYVGEIAHKLPDAEVVEFAWDRNLGGPTYCNLVASAELPKSMRVVRLDPAHRLQVSEAPGGQARVTAHIDGNTGSSDFDLVVMAAPHVGDGGLTRLAGSLGADLDSAGFVLASDRRLTTFESRVAGVFVAGSAAAEKPVPDAAAHAAAAAGAALSALVPGRKLVREATTAAVDDTRCGGCRICALACPYKAIAFDEVRSVATINELLCHGCGTCAAACPSSAIMARGFSNEELLAEITTLAMRPARILPGIS
jgi:heterodisulfide reductase subunit A